MRRIMEFLKSKGFYIALGTGIVAFAALMVVYNYTNTKDNLTREQAIDLNQPVQQEDTQDADQQSANNDLEAADKQAEETDMAGSDGVIKDEELAGDTNAESKDDTDENQTVNEASAEDEDETVAAASDGAEPEAADDGQGFISSLEYDGEQSLTWPLVGNVILPYSMDTTVYFQTLDAYKCNPGMMIQGDEGSDVIAAYEGVVTSVETNKEFGTVVKVDMGNGYEAVYGQLMNVCVGVGDSITTAQNIAEVGPASSYYTEEGNHLYFAVTKDGVPVSPMALIK